jgi:putative peptidoglycan binding protein
MICHRSGAPTTVLEVDVKVRSTVVPGSRLVLLAILSVMALIADMPATAAAVPGGAAQVESAPTGETPFDRQGMWIWYVSRSDGGDLARIVARAQRSGVGTLYVKAGDGGDTWSQFDPALIEALHQAGLDVCAWQFVYGERPVAEARVGATAVRRGADCLAIDAESHYEGRYAAADRYVRALRARIGPSLPVSLAGFPYVDYHPSFPYSVFFGPGGATYNQPQMYWKTIGTSVRAVFEHTFLFNRLWGHPVYPLGQTYDSPGRKGVLRFRRFAASYEGLPPSWWSWQETTGGLWGALGATIPGPVFGYTPIVDQPLLKRGSKGDLVVWAQQHLRGAGQLQLPVTGVFGKLTRAAVRSFQGQRGLPADGAIGPTTWQALLAVEPVRTRWAARSAASPGAASASRALPAKRPLSASLPARGYEIDPGPAP